MPFYAVIFMAMLMITFIPSITLFIPNILGL